jgi:hypothetical protein
MNESLIKPCLPCQLRVANRACTGALTLLREASTPSAQATTNSTITTAPSDNGEVDFIEGGGGGGEEGRGEEGEEEGGEVARQLPPLRSVFDCSYIKIRVVKDGKDGWECGWCSNSFAQRYASRALRHVLKIKKSNGAICKATIPNRFLMRYLALFNANVGQLASKKHSNKPIEEYMELQQDSAVGNSLMNWGVVVSGLAFSLSSISPFSFAPAGTSTTSLTSIKGSRAPPFALSSQRSMVSATNMDIQKSNNATIEMAIANFFHCNNIPDSAVELPRFIRLLPVCCLVGKDFILPHQ